MVSNVFTGLYTESWNVWVWVAVLVGPVLIWLYTVGEESKRSFYKKLIDPFSESQAIYSVIPPKTFAT